MKTAAVLIMCLALIVGILPQFTDCQSRGKAIELPNGKSVPMKCHWTARAEIAVSVPLLLCGLFMLLSGRKETCRQQAALAIALGLSAVLLPTMLIGVCAKADMVCHALMKPMLTLAGIFVMALGALLFVLGARHQKG